MKYFLLLLFSSLAFGVQEIRLLKNAGMHTIIHVLQAQADDDYPGKVVDASANFEGSGDLTIRIPDGESRTLALDALTDASLPTCVLSGLDITINVGTFIVADVTPVVADGSLTKFAKAVLTFTSPNFAIEVLTKTDGAYGAPVGSAPLDLCESSVPALGSTLTMVENFIR